MPSTHGNSLIAKHAVKKKTLFIAKHGQGIISKKEREFEIVKFSKKDSTSRRRRVTHGADTSSRPLIGTGAQHVLLLPPDRGATPHVVAAYQGTMPSLRLSVGRLLPSPIQPVVPIPSERFFFLPDSP